MRYRKKPIEVQAMRWDSTNTQDVVKWMGGWDRSGVWLKQKVTPDGKGALWFLVIPTLEGEMEAMPGDWVIKGVKGEFYPCKPDIFAATYEAI